MGATYGSGASLAEGKTKRVTTGDIVAELRARIAEQRRRDSGVLNTVLDGVRRGDFGPDAHHDCLDVDAIEVAARNAPIISADEDALNRACARRKTLNRRHRFE